MGRWVVVFLVVVFGLVSLGGCALVAPKDGQSAAHANSTTVLPVGVEKVEVSYDSSLDGFTRRYQVRVSVVVADGFAVADFQSDAVMRWLVRQAWSINDHRAVSMPVRLMSEVGGPIDWDYEGAYERLGLERKLSIIPNSQAPWISFGSGDVESLFGEWPGEVPETPSGLFTSVP